MLLAIIILSITTITLIIATTIIAFKPNNNVRIYRNKEDNKLYYVRFDRLAGEKIIICQSVDDGKIFLIEEAKFLRYFYFEPFENN